MIVVVPMAGRGSRFANEGYKTPKPLIEVEGKPMFAWAIRSLDGVAYNRVVVIALKEHEEEYQVSKKIAEHIQGVEVNLILLDEVTEGQLCTVLTAKEFINKEEDVLVISSDTWVVSSIGSDIKNKPEACKGLISVANMPGDRWSFAKLDEAENVVEVAEKKRISDHASTGLYYFTSGKQLVHESEAMISNQETTRGEYYVIPVYQKLIDQGEVVRVSLAERMWDMGTPDSLQQFLSRN